MRKAEKNKTAKRNKSPQRYMTGLLLFFFFLFIWGARGYGKELGDRHLFLCIDSIPYSVYLKAVDDGLFKDFRPASRMISTFPALTNYAWAVILDTGRVEGYQTRYYNPALNKIEGGFQDLFKSKGFPNKFDYIEENLVSQLAAYILGSSSIQKKMKNLSNMVLSAATPRLFFAFIGVSDIVAHMKGEKGLRELLHAVDSKLNWIRSEHQKKFGEPIEITMVSDHANTLKSGKVVNVYRFLRENNFKPVKKLKGPDDVIYHTSGILSVAPFYIQGPRKMDLVQALLSQPWAELVVTYKKDQNIYFVLSQAGRLTFTHSPENSAYKILGLTGEDPIGLTHQGLPLNEWIPQSEVFQASLKTNFPDCLKRIQMALDGNLVRYPAQVLVSIKYGYESGSDRLMNLLSGLKKKRHGTHGGLAALDSVGFIASTRQTFPEWVSAHEVHRQFKGSNFALKYEALTFLWEENGECRMRLGQPLLEKPEAASVQFRLKTLANQKYTVSNSSASFAVDIPSKGPREFPLNQPQFFDVSLPASINPGYIYRIQAQVLDDGGNVLAQTKTHPFQINHVRGYIRIPIRLFFDPPKKYHRRHWAQATQLIPQ